MPLSRKPFISRPFRMTPLHRSSYHGCWIQRCFCRGRRALRIGFSPWEATAPASSAVAVLAEICVRNFLMNLCSHSRRDLARFSKKLGGASFGCSQRFLSDSRAPGNVFAWNLLLGSLLLQRRSCSSVGRDSFKVSSMSRVWMICSI